MHELSISSQCVVSQLYGDQFQGNRRNVQADLPVQLYIYRTLSLDKSSTGTAVLPYRTDYGISDSVCTVFSDIPPIVTVRRFRDCGYTVH